MKKLLPIICIVFLYCHNTFSQVVAKAIHPKDSLTQRTSLINTIKYLDLAISQNSNPDTKQLAGLYLNRGLVNSALKFYTKAIVDFTKAINKDPEHIEAYFNRGLAYEYTNNIPSALSDYKKAIPLAKGDQDKLALLYNNIGFLNGELKKYDEAIKADSMAIALRPQFAPPYTNRGRMYGFIGKYQLAINDLTTAMYGYQSNNTVLSMLLKERGNMKRHLNQFREAVNDYSLAIEVDPNNKFAIVERALAYSYNKDYQLAIEELTRTMSFYQNDGKRMAMLYNYRASAELGLQQYEKVIKDDSLAISLDPGLASAYWGKADGHVQFGDYKLAIEDFHRALPFYQNNKPAQISMYTSMAYCELGLGNYQKVIETCNLAIAVDPKAWSPYLYRGKAYFKKMDKNTAVNDFKKILELDTTKSSVDYAFALLYTGAGEKALDVMQKNFISTTDSFMLANYYYNTACILSIMDKKDEANSYLKKCIEGGFPKKFVRADEDLDNLRNTPGYKAIMD